MKRVSQPQVSVVIPTYNGAGRLPAVLRALAEQDVAASAFELVVVDNASTDNTATAAVEDPARLSLESRGFTCRVVSEARQGALYARLRGTMEARAPLICFLDDDNIPAPDYVRRGIEALADTSVGLLVSRVIPRWEAPPSPAIARRSWLFAITDNLGDSPIDFGAKPSLVPSVTAGMWVRHEAFVTAIASQPRDTILPGRTGKALCSGEDIEIGVLIGRAGYRRVYVPQLRLMHLIPANRLHIIYLCRLIAGVVRGELTLRERYENQPYGFASRLWACARLLASAMVAPAVMIQRRDGLRESLFILASRWAQLRGPYSYAQTPGNHRLTGRPDYPASAN